MASTTFTDNITPIISAWLNDVNSVTYTLFGNGSAYSGVLTLAGTTDATSITTGMSKNAGGASIQKALWVGGLANIAGAVTLQSTINVTGVATLTAQPILSSLTASQAVFSDGSKGLVSNAITGTGSVVMSINAILVTPDIGTPSAGVATNLTGTAAGLTAGTASAVAVGGITGLGSGVGTALAVNVGSAGAPVVNGGALGTPSSGVATNLTGTASGLSIGGNAATATLATTVTTNANLTGDVTSVGNAATVVKINGTSLAVLATGILKNTTTTGVPSIAVAGDFPTLNQNTSGSSASCTGNAATASAVAVGGITGLGTGVGTALAVNVGSAGAPVLFNGAGGTPSSMTATNLTGTASGLTAGAVAVGGITGLGTGVGAALAIAVGSVGGPVTNGGALGTPSSGVATNLTGTAAGLSIGGNAATATTATGTNALYSATTTVNVSSATAPTAGQALVATASTSAIWVNNYGAPNLLINPNWQVDQINEGTLYTYSGAAAVGPDGWSGSATGAGVFKVRTLADPDNAALKCMEITCTTADASIATGDNYYIYSAIEGYDAAALQFGTASGVPLTVQFKFKTNVTGVYGISLANSAGNRRYIGIITVSNTSENEYSLTVTPDTAGTWLYTNGVGVYLRITLAAGATFQSTAGAWAAGAEQTTSAQCNFMSANTNVAYLKRIQLIPGSVVQAYKPADIQKELAKCQRYYAKTFAQGVAPVQAVGSMDGGLMGIVIGGAIGPYTTWSFPTAMRATPTTITTYNPLVANANWRRFGTADETVLVYPATSTGVVIGATTATANDIGIIHATATARLS